MFTGIVEEVGRVVSRKSPVLTIEGDVTLKNTKLGDSVAVNGVCLTVTSLKGKRFTADVSPETDRRTNLSLLKTGSPVNLERPLAYGSRMGGHLMEGHIDSTGKILSIKPEKESYVVTIQSPTTLAPYVVEKGFIAVDGISLTVVSRNASRFSIAVIPYTYKHTTLGTSTSGSIVNLEADILAKYVESLTKKYAASPRSPRRPTRSR